MHQGWPSHILSMLQIEWSYVLGIRIDNGDNTNKISLSKEVSKSLSPCTSMLSKSIVVRSDLDLFLDFVNLKAWKKFKQKENEVG